MLAEKVTLLGLRPCGRLALLLASAWPLGVKDAQAQSCAAKTILVAAGVAAGTFGPLILRHNDWWTEPTTGFRTTWDASASRGQDRLLHASIAHTTATVAGGGWRWACLDQVPAAWAGAAVGLAVSLPKEIGDGLHQGRGFSIPDMMFATAGALLPAFHQTWPRSRVLQYKATFWPSSELRASGSALPNIENDYAGMTFFLTVHPHHLATGWPEWLGLALGHSVNQWIIDPPEHEWVVAFDIAWHRTGVDLPDFIKGGLDLIHVPGPGIKVSGRSVSVGFF